MIDINYYTYKLEITILSLTKTQHKELSMLKRLFSRKQNSQFKIVKKQEMKSSACCCIGDDPTWDFGL